MRYLILLIAFVVSALKSHGQQYVTMYYNLELQAQVTANQATRMASEALYGSSYRNQAEYYTNARDNLTQIVYYKNHIYNQLKNVNHALKQGKQLESLYYKLQRLFNNMVTMTELTADKPQYAVWINRFYEKLYVHAVEAYTAVDEHVMKEDTDYLMDSYDRQFLLNKIQREVNVMNGWTLHIIKYLQNADKKPYFRHIKFLDKWYIQDRAIINRIMKNYDYVTN